MADIKDKIRKLLALATSPYEAEAMAAMLKAKELMAKYKLTELDFSDTKEQKLVHLTCDDIKWTTDSGEIWVASLCGIIAENYCCCASWHTPHKTRTHILVITGMQEDAEVCKQIIEYAVEFVRGAIKALQRKYRRNDPKSIAQSYAAGFIEGLGMAYEEQKDEHPEWGLVIVKPEEVKQYEDSLGCKSVKAHSTVVNPLAKMKGFNDGMEFNSRKVING